MRFISDAKREDISKITNGKDIIVIESIKRDLETKFNIQPSTNQIIQLCVGMYWSAKDQEIHVDEKYFDKNLQAISEAYKMTTVPRRELIQTGRRCWGKFRNEVLPTIKNPCVGYEEEQKEQEREILEQGPLYTMFPCSTSKIMDFIITFHRYDYSISDIAKNSGVTFKTGLNEVRKLESENIILFTRKVGKALMYKFNPDSTKAKSMRKLVLDMAVKRAKNQND